MVMIDCGSVVKNKPCVSVVIPSWNGLHLLPDCLAGLRAQRRQPSRIVVVDNGSTDGTLAWLRGHAPDVELIALPRNLGVAAAFNAGIAVSLPCHVALLNNDVIPEPAWLGELVAALDLDPAAGSYASKLLFASDRRTINSAGDLFRQDGTPGNRGVWEVDRGQYDRSDYVFGASGGAALYRAEALADVGPFDESFESYCEDVDWAFRAQLAGYHCRFVPTARAYHVGSATGGGVYASYHCGRNFIATVVKDMPGGLWRRHWRKIVGVQVRLGIESFRHGREPAARARLRGQVDALRRLPELLASRRVVQRRARVGEIAIEGVLTPV